MLKRPVNKTCGLEQVLTASLITGLFWLPSELGSNWLELVRRIADSPKGHAHQAIDACFQGGVVYDESAVRLGAALSKSWPAGVAPKNDIQ